MIAISTDSGFLELSSSTQIEFNINSPLFLENDKVKGNYTLDFTIPNTPHNIAMLGHADVIENSAQFQARHTAQIYIERAPYKRGILTIKKVSAKSINVNFTEGISTIAELLKNTSLKSLINKEYTVTISQNVGKWATLEYVGPTTGDVRIRVNGVEHYTTISAGNVSAAVSSVATKINNESGLYAEHQVNNRIKIGLDGTLDLEKELHIEPVEPDTFTLFTSYLTQFNTDYKLWLTQWFSETPPDDIICWPVVNNPEMYDKPGFNKFINQITFGLNFGNRPGLENDPVFSVITPYPRVKWMLEQIEEGLGITIESPLKDDPGLDNLYYYHPNTIGFFEKFVGEKEFYFWKNKFNLSDLMPDMPVNEFLKQIAEPFNLAIDYSERGSKFRILPREAIELSAEHTDITSKSGPVKGIENTGDKGITLVCDFDEENTDQPLIPLQENDPYSAYVVGEGEQEVKLKVSGLREVFSFLPGVSDITTANLPFLFATHEPGADIGMKLFFYQGINSTDFGGSYGYGSIKNATYSLSFYGTNGLYEKWWKYWAHFLQNRALVDRDIEFTLADLATLDMFRKYRIDRVNYLLKSVRVVATMKGLKIADVEAYKT